MAAVIARALAVLAAASIIHTAALGQPPAFRFMKDLIPAEAEPALGLADFDGDGDLDLLTNGTGIYLNDGNGLFTPHPVASPVTTATGIVGQPPNTPCVIGDLDGDGDQDVLTWPGYPYGLVRWLNQGAGALVADNSGIPSAYVPVSALALGDVDQDGDLDLVIGVYNYGACSVCTAPMVLWRNDGTGFFTESPGSLPSLPVGPPQILLRDFDGDGDLDLLTGGNNFVGSPLLSSPMIFWNTGGGVFSQTGVTLPVSGQNLVAAGDVDGNGLADLAFDLSPAYPTYSCIADATPSILLNQGGGAFVPMPSSLGTSIRAFPVLVDLDANGRADLLRLSPRGATAHLLGSGSLGQPLSTAPAFIVPLNINANLSQALAAVTGDIDGDGDQDVVLFTGQRNQVIFTDSTGHPRAAAGTLAAAWTPTYRAFAAADLEGDGDLDLMLGFSPGLYPVNSGVLYTALNDGAGNLTEGAGAVFGGGQLTGGAAFDADGDGDADLYGTEGATYSVAAPVHRVLINSGGAFTVSQVLTIGTTGAATMAVRAGDLDGDGDMDVVLGMVGYPFPGLYASPILLNDGTGNFQIASYLPSAATYDVALADVDGDGDLDIVQANTYTASSSALFLNDGSAHFTQDPAFPAVSAVVVQAADLDLDGDVDLLMNNAILPNSAGSFGVAGYTPVPGWTTGCCMPWMSLVDVDTDGYPDLVFSNGWLCRNFGGTTAFGTPEALPAPLVGPIVHGDFDRDGDEDFVAHGSPYLSPHGPAILTNMKRQLARRLPARAGRLTSLEIGGAPGTTWFLFASTGVGNLPLPPFGTALLDLTTIQLAAMGTVSPSGISTISGIAPTGPGVVGVSVWWQAAMLEPQGLRLTGREVTTIAAY